MKKRWAARVVFGLRTGRKVEEFARINVIGCSVEHAMSLATRALSLAPHPRLVAQLEPLVRVTSSPSTLRSKRKALLAERLSAARRKRRRQERAARSTGGAIATHPLVQVNSRGSSQRG